MLGLYLSLIDTADGKNKFEEIYHTYRNLMFFVAKEILSDDNLAEDAVQEAFLRVAKNFHKVGENKCHQTKNFLVIIVRNVALTMVSKEKLTDDDTAIEYMSAADNTFDTCNYKELVGAVMSLPETYRDVLYLQCVCDYSVEDIASYLGLNVSATKKRAQRGRRILQEKLREEGYHE